MLQLTVNDEGTYEIKTREGQLQMNNTAISPDIQELSNGLISILYKDKSYTALVEQIDTAAKTIALRINGELHTVNVKEPIDQLLSSMGMDMKAMHKAEPVKAPMPGMILKILVEPGQQISKGDGLIVLEAMKMENILKANTDARVKAVKVSPRTAVEKGAVLIELE
jgi:biotin carboxyl carrier protein